MYWDLRKGAFIKVIAITSIILLLQGCVTTVAQLENQYPSKPANKAFAIGSKDRAGMAWGQPTVELAIDKALQSCRSVGASGCRITKVNYYSAQIKQVDYFSRSSTKNYGHERMYKCDDVSKAHAYTLLMNGHFYLDRDGDGHPCEWEKSTYRVRPSPMYKPNSSNCHWVKGYRKKNGTYVSGYQRCS